MTFWMRAHARSLSKELRARADAALDGRARWGLGLLAFQAVGREGLETVVFTLAIIFSTSTVGALSGAAIGLAGALAIAFVIYHLGHRLNLARFFTVIGILLMIFAAGLLADTVENLQQLGWLPVLDSPMWHSARLLSENSALGDVLHNFFGYSDAPTPLQLLVYVAYLGIAAAAYLGLRARPRTPADRPHPAAQRPAAEIAAPSHHASARQCPRAPEGLALLRLAEAYLRVPDAATGAKLIAEKLLEGDWRVHRGASRSARVNAITHGLMLARALVSALPPAARLLRPWVGLGMQILGRQFVFERDIERSLRRAARPELRAFSFSYDMLGESARTDADAQRYRAAYHEAIVAVGRRADRRVDSARNDGVSVKLSALNCRYEPLQREHAVAELIGTVSALALAAREHNIGLTIDAEESERLDMSLAVIAAVACDRRLQGWDGFGLAVQAYQPRAPAVIEWAAQLARRCGLRLTLRLVKGAYWDVEIQRAQQLSLAGFPVYTRKCATDVSYLACARRLLQARELLPAFATHNARSVASILRWSDGRRDFEFQRLHGMGAGLYERLIGGAAARCRVYAPVGGYAELLPYLVRRLLENGANAGFVYQLASQNIDDDRLLLDPVVQLQRAPSQANEAIVAPKDLFPDRSNSAGIDLSDPVAASELLARLQCAWQQQRHAAAIVDGVQSEGSGQPVRDPARVARVIGTIVPASPAQLSQALRARTSRTAPVGRARGGRPCGLPAAHRRPARARARCTHGSGGAGGGQERC